MKTHAWKIQFFLHALLIYKIIHILLMILLSLVWKLSLKLENIFLAQFFYTISAVYALKHICMKCYIILRQMHICENTYYRI
jgi:hypothetical protein